MSQDIPSGVISFIQVCTSKELSLIYIVCKFSGTNPKQTKVGLCLHMNAFNGDTWNIVQVHYCEWILRKHGKVN